MAVVTGKGERSARITLEHIGLDEVFEYVAAGSTKRSIKSSAIEGIVSQWGLDPEVVAYVGDVPSDVEHAHAASVVAVSAAWKPDADVPALAQQSPEFLLTSEDELAAWAADHVKAAAAD